MSGAADGAIVFDMDGVLIDSEPLWRRTEIECFGAVGLEIDEEDCLQTMGLRIDEAVSYWFVRSPWKGPTCAEVADRIVSRMVETIRDEAVPMAGVHDAIDAAKAQGLRLALASSSSMQLIETVLECFELTSAFEVARSAETEAHGKPHPDVYRSTLRDLGVSAGRAIAVEDSANGMKSALAAGMRCIAIPDPGARTDPRFAEATWRLETLIELPHLLQSIDFAPLPNT